MNAPEGLIKKRAQKVVDAGMNIPLAQLTESITTNDKLDALLSKEDIVIPEYPEFPEHPTEIAINNLPEIQKVEVLNFPEQKAPVVNIEAPVVNVEAPIVEMNNDEVVVELKNISQILSKEEIESIEKTEIVDDKGKSVNFKSLFDTLAERIGNLKIGGGGSALSNTDSAKLDGIKPLSGDSNNGQVELTSANTWYAVPSTVPSASYVLVVTQENATGTIRWGFDNTGTPSATNGNQAPNELTVKLAAGQVVYYASSTAGDDVNFTTKII